MFPLKTTAFRGIAAYDIFIHTQKFRNLQIITHVAFSHSICLVIIRYTNKWMVHTKLQICGLGLKL